MEPPALCARTHVCVVSHFWNHRYFKAENPSLGAIVLGVIAALVVYDFVFYWVHRIMHKSKRFGQLTRHGVHHQYVIVGEFMTIMGK